MIYTLNKLRYIVDYNKLALMTLEAQKEIQDQKAISYDELIEKLDKPWHKS